MPEVRSDDTVSLPEAAELLGVHYMTAYRYVRTGRLEARVVRGVWQVERRAIELFLRSPAQKRAAPERRSCAPRAHSDGQDDGAATGRRRS